MTDFKRVSVVVSRDPFQPQPCLKWKAMRFCAVSTITVLVVLSIVSGARATTCGPQKPVPVSGRLCGRLIQPDHRPAAGVEIRLLADDVTRAVKSVVLTDAKGQFTFPIVANGRYLIAAEDFGPFDVVQIVDGASTICRKRETVMLPLPAMSCFGGIERPVEKPVTVRGTGLKKSR